LEALHSEEKKTKIKNNLIKPDVFLRHLLNTSLREKVWCKFKRLPTDFVGGRTVETRFLVGRVTVAP
jgi:hypothetical protein